MIPRYLTCLAALSAFCLAAAAVAQNEEPEKPPTTQPTTPPHETKPAAKVAAPRVVLEIALGDEDWGRIVLELTQDKTPKTAENFLRYVDEGFYDGTIFHRVVAAGVPAGGMQVIQGGGYTSLTEDKKAGLHGPIQNEARTGLKNTRGTISMARTSAPHSATSQFFINLVDNAALDYPGRDGAGYCVFGKVIEGMDVVDRIKGIETRASPHSPPNAPPERSQPVNPPMIKKARQLGPDEKLVPAEPKAPTAPKPAVKPKPEPDREPPPSDNEKEEEKAE